MKRLKKLATILPNSSKLSSKHISKIKGGANGSGSNDHDKRTDLNPGG